MITEWQAQPVTNESVFNIVQLLKACTIQKDLVKGSKLHTHIRNHKFLEANFYIANSLVNMYAKCGALAKAQQVLTELPDRNVVTWNALIAGYAQQGQGEEALKCYDSMLCEGHSPNAVTFTCALKACGSIGSAIKGEEIHEKIVALSLLEKDIMLGSILVDMYAKCGALAKAHQVFKELPAQDVVSWSSLIAGYAQQGQGEKALECYDNMQCEGHLPDLVTFVCALKACGSIGAATKGEQIHEHIANLGMLNKDTVIGNAVVDMYAKCGTLEKAQQVFEELPVRDVVTWGALIAGYAEHGQGEQALKCFNDMQCEGHSPNVVTCTCALKACGKIGSAVKCQQTHDKIFSLCMLEKDILLGNTLVDMYAKCGAFGKAQEVLKELPVLDVLTWNSLMGGYVQQGHGEQALDCLDSMQNDGHSPNAVTFTFALKACGSIGAAVRGKEIHDKIARMGMLEKNVVLGSTLVDMYTKCGAPTKAQQVFEELPVRNVITWNALIAGYADEGQGYEALRCYDVMQLEGSSPNVVTFTCALKACGRIGAAAKGEKIHSKIVSLNMSERDLMLGNALVDMYARCNALEKAQQVFEELPIRDFVTWSALIAGYAEQEQGDEALKCFDSMQQEGHTPHAGTFTYVLKACGSKGAAAKGEQIHEKVVNLGMLYKDVVLGNTLVDMYAKSGAVMKAQQVLEELPVRNEVTWTSVIAGYVQKGQGEEALKCYDSMQLEGHSQSAVTFIFALKACEIIGAAAKGEQIHEKIVTLGLLEKNVVVGNTLVDMYVKCGALVKAQQVLEGLPIWDVVTWTALIGGYAHQGMSLEALHCFERMKSKAVKPDATTFLCMLNAYCHSGLMDQAEQIFSAMKTEYGFMPDEEHYCCMIDLFGRAGKFNKMLVVIEKMPSADYFSVWVALLSACSKWGEVKIGRFAFECALHLNETIAAIYCCMANIYAAAQIEGNTN